jgi:predicted DNA-binding WGR domain protein
MAPDADNPTLLQVLVLERIDPARNMARFYVLSIEPTLFEDLALVRRWGRIGSAGRERIDLHPVSASRADRAREMARSQEAPRIPAPGLTAGDRLPDAGSSREGRAPRKVGNSYRRLTLR